MTIYALDPGSQPPQTSYNYCDLANTQQCRSFSLEGLKCMQLAYARPTMSCIHLVIVLEYVLLTRQFFPAGF